MAASNPRTTAEEALHADPVDAAEVAEAVASAARGLRYGSIEVVVHDARVVQVIRTERRRIVK